MNTDPLKNNLFNKLLHGLAILALLLCLAAPAYGEAAVFEATFTVNDSGDDPDDDPDDDKCLTADEPRVCTLRAAIMQANFNVGHDTIIFEYVDTISPLTALPPLTDPDGVSIYGQGYYKDHVTIDGTNAPTGAEGLVLASGNNVIQDLAVSNFYTGIEITGSGNIIGTDGDGVGDEDEGNVISGNRMFGIHVINDSMNTVIAGNLIGLNTAGDTALGNVVANIYFDNGPGQARVGTNGDGVSDSLERNVISASNVGIAMDHSGPITVTGNYIGLNAAGDAAIPNVNGIALREATGILIGTNGDGQGDEAERNIISGSSNAAVAILLSTGTTIAGNYIGLDASGNAALANKDGVWSSQSSATLIGTDGNGQGDAAERNVISGNTEYGVHFVSTITDTVLAGNYIGLNASGTAALGNGTGVAIESSSEIRIGTDGNGQSDDLERNLISGNTYGIALDLSDYTTIAGNYIGTNANGDASIDNYVGVTASLSTYTIIGTDGNGQGDAAERNLISGSDLGIGLYDSDHATIAGNYIGINANGDAPIENRMGIIVSNSSDGLIGTDGDGQSDNLERNIISGSSYGISIVIGSDRTSIAGNYIGTNANGDAAIGNWAGISISDSSDTLIGTDGDGQGDAAERNVISGNDYGVFFESAATGMVLAGNYIGLNASGTAALGNEFGVYLVGAENSRIGTDGNGQSDDLERNIISGNTELGFVMTGSSYHNTVAGNYIGTGANGTTDLGNGGAGISIEDSTDNLISRNRIAFSHSQANVRIFSGTGNTLSANEIYGGLGLGIDLEGYGVTPNDDQDLDSGPNNLQNYPILQTVVSLPGQTTITGTLNSLPNSTFRLEFFANTTCHVTGYGEGEVYLGVYTSTTNAQGNASFVFVHPAVVLDNYAVTATATDADGNTSEFSGCTTVDGMRLPGAATHAATDVDAASATLHGTVNANELTTAVSFQLTTVSGNYASPTIVAASPASVDGTTDTPVSGSASGLQAGSTYYYRVAATSAAGTAYGDELSFTTQSVLRIYLAIILR